VRDFFDFIDLQWLCHEGSAGGKSGDSIYVIETMLNFRKAMACVGVNDVHCLYANVYGVVSSRLDLERDGQEICATLLGIGGVE